MPKNTFFFSKTLVNFQAKRSKWLSSFCYWVTKNAWNLFSTKKFKIPNQKASLKERIEGSKKVKPVSMSVFFNTSLEIVSHLPRNSNIFFPVVSFYFNILITARNKIFLNFLAICYKVAHTNISFTSSMCAHIIWIRCSKVLNYICLLTFIFPHFIKISKPLFYL